jgi:hypothetical protein
MGFHVVSAFDVVDVRDLAHARTLLREAGEDPERAAELVSGRLLAVRSQAPHELDESLPAAMLSELSCGS